VNPSPAIREMPTGMLNAWRTRIRPRLAAAVLAVFAGVIAVTTVAVSLFGTPSLDVATDKGGASIAWVLPGGGSWQAGIRPGQQVISLAYGPRGETWQLDTVDSTGRGHGASYAGQLTAIRHTLPFGIAACLSALLALIAFARRNRLSGALALLVLLLAQPALRLAGDAVAATAVVGSTPIVAAGWLTVSGRRRWAGGALVIATVLALAWVVARELVVAAFDVTDTMNLTLAVALVGVALITGVPWRRWAGAAYVEPSVAADLGVVGLMLGLAVVAMTTLSAPPWAVLTGAVVLFALYPRVRRRLSGLLEELVLGNARQHASISATEEERARLAHEIHDGPLQELAAVIGRLDDEPQMVNEAGLLRDVAAELRAVTTALRPPVLDDLGLGAAVAFVVDQARAQAGTATTIACEVEDRAGLGRTGRVPRDVELAGFRVVQEALANAVRHAHAQHIIVAGLVSPSEVHLRISDDGLGIDPAAVREARRTGHLGLMSMRQRAAAVGAELAVDSHPGDGTRVSFEWRPDR